MRQVAFSDKFLAQNVELLIISLVFSAFFVYFAWYKRFFKIKERHEKLKVSFTETLGVFVIYIGISLLYPFIAEWTFTTLVPKKIQFLAQNFSEYKGWVNVFGLLLVLLAVMVYVEVLKQVVRRQVWGDTLFENPIKFLRNISVGFLTWFISFPVVVFVGQVMTLILLAFGLRESEQLAIQFLKFSMPYKTLFGILIFCMIVIVPVIEETLFRGFLQNWLARHLGRFWAVVLASCVFAFFHFSLAQGWSNLTILSSLFTLSCFLGFIYIRQHSLWAPISLHATFNGVSILLISLLGTG